MEAELGGAVKVGVAPPTPPTQPIPLLPSLRPTPPAVVRTATVVDIESGDGMMLETGTELRGWMVERMPVGEGKKPVISLFDFVGSCSLSQKKQQTFSWELEGSGF